MTNIHPLSAEAKPFALIEADFADGTYQFGLTWKLATDWEAETGRSMYGLFLESLRLRFMRLEDIREIIRLALIGGGTEPGKALRLVRTYVEERPAAENIPLAMQIFDAFCHGADGGPTVLTEGAPVGDEV